MEEDEKDKNPLLENNQKHEMNKMSVKGQLLLRVIRKAVGGGAAVAQGEIEVSWEEDEL